MSFSRFVFCFITLGLLFPHLYLYAASSYPIPSTLLPLSHQQPSQKITGCQPENRNALPSTLRPLPVTCRPIVPPVFVFKPAPRPKIHSLPVSLRPIAPRYSLAVSVQPTSRFPVSAMVIRYKTFYPVTYRLSPVARPVKRQRMIAVPAQTVMNVSLLAPLHSRHAVVGDTVTVNVHDPVYIGPYLVIPSGSKVTGHITAINRRSIKHGPNPYLVVQFQQLKRPGYTRRTAINAELIAYKTGLKKEDYLWKLPRKTSFITTCLWAGAEGALTGFFTNPLFGPPIGASVSIMAALVKNKLVHRGTIMIKPKEVIPVAVETAFYIPVTTESFRGMAG